MPIAFVDLRAGTGSRGTVQPTLALSTSMIQRPALRLVEGGLDTTATWLWFCGHCAAPSPGGAAPPPTARVCTSCGLGLLLEAREDAVPSGRDAFLVVDSALLVQAMSREAQSLLGVTEEMAIDKPVAELLVPADAEAQGRPGFAASIATPRTVRIRTRLARRRAAVEHVRRPAAGADRHLRAAAGGAGRAGLRAAADAARRHARTPQRLPGFVWFIGRALRDVAQAARRETRHAIARVASRRRLVPVTSIRAAPAAPRARRNAPAPPAARPSRPRAGRSRAAR